MAISNRVYHAKLQFNLISYGCLDRNYKISKQNLLFVSFDEMAHPIHINWDRLVGLRLVDYKINETNNSSILHRGSSLVGSLPSCTLV